MAARSLMALDYANYQTNNILRKHAKNRPLGDIEHKHSYVPPQPVLSCRTVDIDLPGTRTYRPKSTLDILEEQQRLIRKLYNSQRASTSAPPRQRTEPVARSVSNASSVRRVNIEVKGRPLTSISQTSYQSENKVAATTQKRPKTTGRLKNIQPATDCFMVIKVDKDLLETSQNNREITNKIHSHWKSENNNLAVGKFVRGQKRPDDVPPTLDAWLTFGGAAGESSEGVIDAFASFKNSEEYYNIEGSVGSRVAQQLQKGDKIRIGINGVLQSQDLKVKRWNKENAPAERLESRKREKSEVTFKEEAEEEEREEIQTKTEEVPQEEAVQTEAEADAADGKPALHDDIDDDFKELVIDTLDELLEEDDTMEITQQKGTSPPPPAAPVVPSLDLTDTEEPDEPKMTIPLSWDDQCTKPDVRILHSKLSHGEPLRPIMSETFPIKFEKLISADLRPRLAQARADGYKIKHRASSRPSDGRASSSKVKVVYIDPLTNEEEEKVKEMSVDEIVNHKLEGRSRENTATPHRRSIKNHDDSIMAINDDTDVSFRPQRISSTKGGSRGSRPASNYSMHSDHGGIPSPKLRTPPVHSSINRASGELSIMTRNAQSTENQRGSKSLKIAPVKPLHRSGAGQGSSIKAGPIQGETEYIKITSQLKIAPGSVPSSAPLQEPASFSPYHFTHGASSPTNMYQGVAQGQNEGMVNSPRGESQPQHQNHFPSREATPSLPEDSNDNRKVDEELNDSQGSVLSSESPAPTTVAISIPTADELSDKESPDHSPSRYPTNDDLTGRQRRERDMRNEQIDQITDLLGGAIVDS